LASLGHRGPIYCCRKVKMNVNNWNSAMTTTTRHWLRAHLFALTMTSLKIGCRVKSSLCCLHQSHLICFHVLAGIKGDSISSQVHFDLDSFPIRINNHASYCMANSPHLFDDLILLDVGKVDGINYGLAILGKGTFKFSISNDNDRVHHICIPNSLYLPKLHGCLLSPQRWAQEAGDNQTWMGNFAHCCTLALVWRPEDGPFSHLNQHADLPYGFLLKHIQGICGHIQSDGIPVLLEGDSSPVAWATVSKGVHHT
jgi:hypothetical protein